MNKMFPVLVASLLLTVLVSCNMPSQLPVDVPDDSSDDTVPADEPTPVPTLPPLSDERDSCLTGDWYMDTPDLDLLVAVLVPIPNIHASAGLLAISFDNEIGTYYYSGSPVIKIDLSSSGDQYIEGEGSFDTRGAYQTQDGTIRFDPGETSSEVISWKAYANGQSADAPGGGPAVSFPLPDVAPYRCTEANLELDTQGPSGTVTMFFTR